MTDTLIPDKAESTAAIDGLSLRTQLFIDGEFRDAAGGGRFATENPATGRHARGGGPWRRGGRRRGGRGRPAGRGRRSLEPAQPRRSQARAAPLGRPDRAQRPRAGDHRDPRRGQADHRHGRPRHARDGRLHPVARRGDRQALRPGRPRAGGRGRDDHPRAGGRRRRGHPVELPGPDGRLEARPGARHRQHDRHQAGVDDLAQPAPDRGAGRRGRDPGRRPQRRDRTRRHRRRGARPPSRHRLPRVHRLDRGRPQLPRVERRRPISSGCCSSSAARARSSCSRT